MHDIKIIRKNPDIFLKKLSERNAKIDIKSLLDLDKKNRELIQNKEKLEQEKKIVYNFTMSIGFWQIAIVVVLVVLLFGRGKISSLMSEGSLILKDLMVF